MTYEEAKAKIPVATYRHFKGNQYRVLYIARHSETKEPLVVYKALYGDGDIWVRPAKMWLEEARPGVKRFEPDTSEFPAWVAAMRGSL